MALLFEGDSVVELHDTQMKCVTNEWEDRATLTVYLAFYCNDQNCTLSEHNITKQTKIDSTDTNNAKKTSVRVQNPKLMMRLLEKEGSIMNEATKKSTNFGIFQ